VAEKAVSAETSAQIPPPRTGVEVVSSEKRGGKIFHSVRDLRNGNLIKGVTKESARKLWHYAIKQTESGVPKEKDIKWHGDIAMLDKRTKDTYTWYDLAFREGGNIHFYYGVTDNGLSEEWLPLLDQPV
jgi:hypothetical protein